MIHGRVFMAYGQLLRDYFLNFYLYRMYQIKIRYLNLIFTSYTFIVKSH
nr:hypothetical protein TDPV-230 [Oriental turtle dovepox virus]